MGSASVTALGVVAVVAPCARKPRTQHARWPAEQTPLGPAGRQAQRLLEQ
jgi:hypothetical protein